MPSTAAGDDAEAQLAGFIDRFDPVIAQRVRDCRTIMRRRFPTAFELVYDNYQALAIGYATTDRASDCIVSLAVYPSKIALSFYYGSAIPDPDGVLQGDGKQNRFIRLSDADILNDPKVIKVIHAAVDHGRLPLPADGPGVTIIKSVSANQRPRR